MGGLEHVERQLRSDPRGQHSIRRSSWSYAAHLEVASAAGEVDRAEEGAGAATARSRYGGWANGTTSSAKRRANRSRPMNDWYRDEALAELERALTQDP